MAAEIVRSPSNFTYDLHDLRDSPAFENARNGLRANPGLTLSACELIHSVGAFCNFQIRDGARTYSVQLSEGYAPYCICQAAGIACKHVFWLVDQIMKAAQACWGGQPGIIRLLNDGSVVGLPNLSQLIMETTAEFLRNNLRWNVQERASTSVEDEGSRPEAKESLQERLKILNWVITPSESVRKHFGAYNRHDRQLIDKVFEDFKALIMEYSEVGGFKERLDRILTQSFTSNSKLVQKKFDYGKTFERYIAGRNPFARDGRSVEQCANEIRHHVEEIAGICRGQIITPSLRWAAIGLLLEILRDVVGNNNNGHVNDNSMDNDLYVHLIANRPGSQFIVNELNDISSGSLDALRSHRDTIKLIEIMLQGRKASEAYLAKFQGLRRRIE